MLGSEITEACDREFLLVELRKEYPLNDIYERAKKSPEKVFDSIIDTIILEQYNLVGI